MHNSRSNDGIAKRLKKELRTRNGITIHGTYRHDDSRLCNKAEEVYQHNGLSDTCALSHTGIVLSIRAVSMGNHENNKKGITHHGIRTTTPGSVKFVIVYLEGESRYRSSSRYGWLGIPVYRMCDESHMKRVERPVLCQILIDDS